ncbi:MAG: hypothetical protein KGH61_04590 [Candidatus Micrarchaeota archaeon]|nr:hypothetical protein [Candidatus Micrarchaeota archaeon]MDE1848195.1 hypothetical protein [Candidatus Micrarchaeota archaeon]MDE1864843.1 hypothetical protein [Candidatus Micrarchaeota archaeon]
MITKPGKELSKEIERLYSERRLRVDEKANVHLIKSTMRRFWKEVIAPYANDKRAFPYLWDSDLSSVSQKIDKELNLKPTSPVVDVNSIWGRGLDIDNQRYSMFAFPISILQIDGFEARGTINSVLIPGIFPPERELFKKDNLTNYMVNLFHFALLDSSPFWHVAHTYSIGGDGEIERDFGNFVDRLALEVKYTALFYSVEQTKGRALGMFPLKKMEKLSLMMEKHHPVFEPMELTREYLAATNLDEQTITQFCTALERLAQRVKKLRVLRKGEDGWMTLNFN